MSEHHRRDFLKTSAAAGASLAAAPVFAQGAGGANERVRVGVVGLRGRGQSHIAALRELAPEGVELAALCDCDAKVLGAAVSALSADGKQVKPYADMRRLLDDRSIDAVTFATPNHWHSLGVVWGCQAGKDVYVEKPGSHNIYEGRKMVEAARRYRRIVQHGTQCRSSENIREGIRALHDGVIGRVYMARGIAYKVRPSFGRNQPQAPPPGLDWDAWLGPAPQQDYSPLRHRAWHFLWDFGNGEIGNQGVHQLDIIRWGMKLDAHPTRVQSMGGRYVHDDEGETPMVQNFSAQWAHRNVLVEFAVRNWHTNTEARFRDVYPFVQPDFPVGTIFLGTEGYMILPDYSSYYTFLGRKREPGPSKAAEGHPIMDTPHFRNWIAAVRSRRPEDLHAEILEGHMAAALNHLAMIAYRTGRTLNFDPKTETFPGDDEANRQLSRNYRPPYVVPAEV